MHSTAKILTGVACSCIEKQSSTAKFLKGGSNTCIQEQKTNLKGVAYRCIQLQKTERRDCMKAGMEVRVQTSIQLISIASFV